MTARAHNILLSLLYFIAALASLCIIVWHADYSVDDMFITFRYADHFLRGEGLVWNPGERVEGYTSFSMLMLLSLLHMVGMNYVVGAKLIGLLGFASVIVTSQMYWHKIYRSKDTRHFVCLLGFILLSVNYPLIVWAMGGMETTLFTMLLFQAIVLVLLQHRSKRSNRLCLIAGALFGFAMLTRPETPLFVAISALYMVFAKHKRNFVGAFFLVLPFALITTLHVLWRYHYYGEFLPNTYFAKLTGEWTVDHLLKGLRYVWAFAKAPPYLLIYLLAILPFMFHKSKHRRENLYLLALILGYLSYVIYAGGDWMKASRLIVPLIPIMVVLLLHVTVQNMRVKVRHTLGAAAAVLFLCFAQKSYYYTTPMAKYPYYWDRIAEYIRKEWKPGTLIAINMAGQIPYLTPEHRYVDMLGINDKHIARLPVVFASGKGNTGHYKGDGKYVLARKPDYLILRDGFSEDLSPNALIFVSEKELVQQPEFMKMYRKKVVLLRLPDSAPIPEKSFKFIYLEKTHLSNVR